MARRGFGGVMMRAYGARDHEATVTGTELVSPGFLRVHLHSATMLHGDVVAPTAAVRFWFPDHEGRDAEHQRAYTISSGSPETGDFTIDVVLHDPAGPASAWARQARPGSTVPVTPFGSTRFDLPDELPAGYLLVGDAASVPALNGILGTVPAEVPIEVYLEDHQDADRLIPLVEHPRARVHRVPRRDETSLAAAIEARDWSDWSAWLAPESGSLKHLRTRLRDEFGFPRGEVHAQAYWYHGRPFGSRRSTAEPEPAAAADAPEAGAPGGADDDATTATSTDGPAAPPTGRTPATTAPAAPPAPPAAPATARRGAWRAQAAGRLLGTLRSTLVLAGVAQAVVTLVQLAPYVLLVELARLLLDGAGSAALWRLGIVAVVLMGGGVLLSTVLMLWLHRVDARFARDLRERLLGTLSRLPLGWFDAHGSGQVKQIVQDDTLSLHYLVTHAVPDAVAAVVAPVSVLVYLFLVDWRLATLLLLPVLAYLFVMSMMIAQSGPKTTLASTWAERMNVEAGAYLDGQPVVRVFGGAAASTFRARLGEYIEFLRAWQQPLIGQRTFIDLVTRPGTFLLLICALGTPLVVTGRLDPVDLLPFLLLGTTFGARLLGIGYGVSGLRTGMLAARRIQVTLDEPPLATRPSAAGAAGTDDEVPAGLVRFDRVGFSYRPGLPVLHDIDLTLAPGTVTALVGPSGSGKSTLAALLARFHDVEHGAIQVGGQDLRTLTADDLYRRVGFVLQQTQLVQGTVRENIALAVPGASQERVEAAARDAQLHDRILRMPHGYDTPLGPDAALSGGERQRLTIARALLADTPVLVLDEATAFADPESEYLVQQALDRLTAGRTVLVIAHRLHTITGVDRIVVLDHGRVVETGTHTELLAADGRYRQLWTAGRPVTADRKDGTR